MSVEFADFTDEDLEAAEEAWSDLFGERAARSLRFNPHHGADGKFSSSAAGGSKIAGKFHSGAELDELDKEVARLGEANGQDWRLEVEPPRNKAEAARLEKAEAKGRYLVSREQHLKSEEVEEGGKTVHKLGGEPHAETFRDPAGRPWGDEGEEWISRQFNEHAPNGYDEYTHRTERAALKDSRGLVVSRARNYERAKRDYETPGDLKQYLADEGARKARWPYGPDADEVTHIYRVIAK